MVKSSFVRWFVLSTVTTLSLSVEQATAKDDTPNTEPKSFHERPISYMNGDSKKARWQLFAKYSPELFGMTKAKLFNIFGHGKPLNIQNLKQGVWCPAPSQKYWYVIEAQIDEADDSINETGVEIELFSDTVTEVTIKQRATITLGTP